MNPVAALLLLTFLILSFISLLLTLPTMVLGLILGPLLSRFSFVIEFLYPTSLGRWLHITLVSWVTQQKNTKSSSNDKNRGYHSRTIEQRIEIVQDRVYLHPLPQFLDNLGYLVVCIPPKKKHQQSSMTESSALGNITVTTDEGGDKLNPIVAFVVDCGQADSILEQVDLISQVHYDKRPIQIQSILSTHKHHDHTAGNLSLLKGQQQQQNAAAAAVKVKLVFGGAVEKVPGCNYPLADGELLPLPKCGNNDMNELVEVEAVATPGHTRGSLAYVLRRRASNNKSGKYTATATGAGQGAGDAAFIFTGDTLFSGGNGVPFEADVGEDDSADGKLPTSLIKATAGNYAMERCFAEILSRCSVRSNDNNDNARRKQNTTSRRSDDQILLFPGHEYTTDLLFRQLSLSGSSSSSDATKWKHYGPQYFFETCAQYYVATHRRALPHSSGKLLSAMTSLRRELLINPQLRLLHRRGELVVRAVQLWHTHFAKTKIDDLLIVEDDGFGSLSSTSNTSSASSTWDNINNSGGGPLEGSSSSSKHLKNDKKKGISTQRRWNLDASDVDRPVFTTLYTAELDRLLYDLDNDSGKNDNNMTAASVAQRLRRMKRALQKPTILRRPIPETLPSDRTIFKTLLGFVLLGSSPCALTLSDSEKMKLPPPIVGSTGSDNILISKKRLVSVLYWLGLLSANEDDSRNDNHGRRIVAMIDQLWKEAREYTDTLAVFDPKPIENNAGHDGGRVHQPTYDTVEVDVEVEIRNGSSNDNDEISVGALRWMIYGIPQKPPCWLSKYCCMPCSSSSSSTTSYSSPAAAIKSDVIDEQGLHTQTTAQPPHPHHHPAEAMNLKQHSGELVKHDVYTCLLCQSAAGCPSAAAAADTTATTTTNNNDEYKDERTDQLGALPSSSQQGGSGSSRPVYLKQSTSSSLDNNEDPSSSMEMTTQGVLNAMLREA